MNSSKTTARLAGLLWILVGVTTGISLGYVRSTLIVFADAATTATNIVASESLFRAGIVSSVLTQVFLLFLGLTLFRLFRRTNKTSATIILASTLVAAAVGVANSLNNIGAVTVLTNPDYRKAFQPEQINALAMIFLRLNNFGIGLLEVFTAIFLFSLGLLIVRSGALPRVLGILLIIGACAFPINTFTKILMPQFHPALITQLTMLCNAFGPLATMLWLLIKGVDEQSLIGESRRT
jgi:hypothetical protein